MTDRELPLTDERIREIAGKAAENCSGGCTVGDLEVIESAIRQALKESQEQWESGKYPGKVTTHWLRVAFERIAACEPEEDVLADYGYQPTPKSKD